MTMHELGAPRTLGSAEGQSPSPGVWEPAERVSPTNPLWGERAGIQDPSTRPTCITETTPSRGAALPVNFFWPDLTVDRTRASVTHGLRPIRAYLNLPPLRRCHRAQTFSALTIALSHIALVWSIVLTMPPTTPSSRLHSPRLPVSAPARPRQEGSRQLRCSYELAP